MPVAQCTVSVIFTVLNEASHIQRLLDSLLPQTRAPDEVVICDGGSTDGTIQIIEQFAQEALASGERPAVKLIVEPGVNISRGRNIAIAAAAGPIIASTDAGVRLADEWLERLVEPWALGSDKKSGITEADDPKADDPLAVAGFFLPDVDGIFTAAMSATVLPLHEDIVPDKFLPSSRSVAFTKESWSAAQGYPEWLDFCEDLLFDFAINAQRPEAPTAFAWAPKAIAYFQPRTDMVSFWKQYYRYARGDGKADLWRTRHAIRYATYLLGLPLLIGLLLLGGGWSWLGGLGLIVGGILFCFRPWQKLAKVDNRLTPGQRAKAALLVPLIRVVGDVAKMAGYPVGLRWRYQNRDRAELDWRKGLR